MSTRLERLRGELGRLGAASFLVTNPVNVRYLSGFASSNAALVVRRDSVALATDGRYVEGARALEGVEAHLLDRDLPTALGERLGELAEPPVAFEAETVTVRDHERLAAGGVELVPSVDVVKRLRAVKEPAEVNAMRQAAGLADRVFERLADTSLVGRTEADVVWLVQQGLREEGADGESFETIVASGPNAARPHHHPGGRAIGRGETVILDLGARVDGYCSDCTRTFATGPLPDELRQAYEVCRDAEETALAEVRPGADARGLDALASEVVERSGLAEVLHGLGHGVGLEIHELPVLRPTAEGTLEPGNAVTIEPGVYLPGRGGVRIEDLVVVTENGAEVLTRFTKELLTLD